MAAATITATVFPLSLTGVNITDATFTTLVAGGSNGVKFLHDPNDLVVLKNDTGGAATFTFAMTTPTSVSAYGGSVSSPTKVVDNGDTLLLKLSEIFKDSSGYVTITCDVAGKALVLDL